MSYLLDKKTKKKKFERIAVLVVCLLLIFYFRTGILKGLSSVTHFVVRPFLVLGNGAGNRLGNFGSYFSSKRMLSLENQNLKLQLGEKEATLANYNSISDENEKMKEILNRKKTKNEFVLAGILNKPNRSMYDTLLIDAGTNDGIVIGQKVFAYGDVPIGYISEAYADSSKVVLSSSPGEKTEVAISGKDVFMEAVGRGGGNFEMILPRDFTVDNGTEVVLPGITPYVLGTVATIVSDPRDSFEKALLTSPINIFELRLVEVEK